MVFVDNTYFYIRHMVRSPRRVSLEYTLSAPAVFISIDTCLDRLGSEFFGLWMALDPPVLAAAELCARKSILTMHACLRVLHSEYSDIVVA